MATLLDGGYFFSTPNPAAVSRLSESYILNLPPKFFDLDPFKFTIERALNEIRSTIVDALLRLVDGGTFGDSTALSFDGEGF